MLWDSSQLGGRLLYWVGGMGTGHRGFPVGYCPEFAFPRQDLQPGGSRGNLQRCDRKPPAIRFCSMSSLRKINGNVPVAEDWLGSRHTWILAPHSVGGSCQRSLMLTKSRCAGSSTTHGTGQAPRWGHNGLGKLFSINLMLSKGPPMASAPLAPAQGSCRLAVAGLITAWRFCIRTQMEPRCQPPCWGHADLVRETRWHQGWGQARPPLQRAIMHSHCLA